MLVRKQSLGDEIAALDVRAFQCPPFPMKAGSAEERAFRYEGKDLVTLQTIVERDYKIPEPQTAQEVIGYYARRIAQDVKLPSQFAALAPKVREFLEERAFGRRVALDGPEMIAAISSNVARFVTVDLFVKALRQVVVQEQAPQVVSARRVSETPAFPYSKATFPAMKTVFNVVAPDNEFEKRFARFLEDAPDVTTIALHFAASRRR